MALTQLIGGFRRGGAGSANARRAFLIVSWLGGYFSLHRRRERTPFGGGFALLVRILLRRRSLLLSVADVLLLYSGSEKRADSGECDGLNRAEDPRDTCPFRLVRTGPGDQKNGESYPHRDREDRRPQCGSAQLRRT